MKHLIQEDLYVRYIVFFLNNQENKKGNYYFFKN